MGSLALCSAELVAHVPAMVLTATRPPAARAPKQYLIHNLRKSRRSKWMNSFRWQVTKWLRLNSEQVGWFWLDFFFFFANFHFRFGKACRGKEWGYSNWVVLSPCDEFLFLTWGYLYVPAALKAAPV